MARVEIPAPGDLIMDTAGNVRVSVAVSLKLAGTVTDATHYSALVGGTSTTGGLVSGSDGTVVDGSGNRRYVDSGVAMDMTIAGRTKQLEPLSASVGSDTAALTVIKPRDIKDRAYGPSVLSTQGAVGDGSSHPLSSSFATLVAAQVVYPHATALTNELDWAAAQKAINEGGFIGSAEGDFKFDQGFQFPVTAEGAVSFVGKGPEKTKWTFTGSSGYAVTIGDGGVVDARRQAIASMTIVGNANADGGLRLKHTRFSGATEVQFYDFTKAGATGVSTTAGGAQAHNYFALISHCRFKNIPIGVAFTSTGGIGGNSNYVQFCHFQQHSTAAVVIDGSAADILLGNEFGATIAIAVRLQGGAQHTKIIGNQFDGPTLTVDLDPATVLDTNLIGNTALATVTTSGVALTGAQYLSTRTCRIDSTGASIPSIIQGGIEVGNYSQTNPTDGIGVAGDVRSDEKVGADYASSGEVRIGAVGPASEAAVQFNRTNTGTTGERLYLSASSIIRTGGKLAADAGIGVGNSAAATEVIGKAVVKKIQVFDAAGTSLGFIPVYSSIT